MPSTLSQEEIDALLADGPSEEEKAAGQTVEGPEPSSTESGEESKSIKNYDFQHPDKFSQPHLSAMQRIHEELARQLGATLYIYLRQNTNFILNSVKQITFGEFISGFSGPATLVLFSLHPLQGNAILAMDNNMTFMVFDRLLGGTGEIGKADRELTEIEKGIIKKLANKILGVFGQAWSGVIEVKPEVEAIETHAELVQVIAPNEAVALVSYEVEMKDMGFMSICLPYLMLEPITSKLGRQIWSSTGSESEDSHKVERELLEKNLRSISLPMTVELGKTTIAIRDLLQLQIQDAIQVDTTSDGEVSVQIQGHTKFYGKPGVLGNKLGVKINSISREGDEI